jgi:hypothetical protein
MNHATVPVTENLDFHVATVFHESLKVYARIAECGSRFGPGELHGRRDVLQAINSLHAATTASAYCLDQQRRPNFPSKGHGLAHVFDGTARSGWHAGSFSFGARAELIANSLDLGRCWADENHSFLLAQPGENRALGKKSIAWMYGIRLHAERRLDDGVLPEVAIRRPGRADAQGAVREPSREGIQIRLGCSEHGFNSQRPASADHAKGYFAAIGDEYAADRHR